MTNWIINFSLRAALTMLHKAYELSRTSPEMKVQHLGAGCCDKLQHKVNPPDNNNLPFYALARFQFFPPAIFGMGFSPHCKTSSSHFRLMRPLPPLSTPVSSSNPFELPLNEKKQNLSTFATSCGFTGKRNPGNILLHIRRMG